MKKKPNRIDKLLIKKSIWIKKNQVETNALLALCFSLRVFTLSLKFIFSLKLGRYLEFRNLWEKIFKLDRKTEI